MICDKSKIDNFIYRVDIGSTRGYDFPIFDNEQEQNKSLTPEELDVKYWLSRTPQVLVIENNQPKIVRSTIKNTDIHQPRDKTVYKYKSAIPVIPAAIPAILAGGSDYNKYLKYKIKYLEAKKLNITQL